MALTILIKFCDFIVHSKPNNMTLSTFPGKISETRKEFLIFCPSSNVAPIPGLPEKLPEKPQPGKLTRPGIEPGPAGLEATMLSLGHSDGCVRTRACVYVCVMLTHCTLCASSSGLRE